MQIKGTENPTCKLCFNCIIKDNSYLCSLTGNKTDKNDKCKKFKYDIFKYKPSAKLKLRNFTKEDFTI